MKDKVFKLFAAIIMLAPFVYGYGSYCYAVKKLSTLNFKFTGYAQNQSLDLDCVGGGSWENETRVGDQLNDQGEVTLTFDFPGTIVCNINIISYPWTDDQLSLNAPPSGITVKNGVNTYILNADEIHPHPIKSIGGYNFAITLHPDGTITRAPDL